MSRSCSTHWRRSCSRAKQQHLIDEFPPRRETLQCRPRFMFPASSIESGSASKTPRGSVEPPLLLLHGPQQGWHRHPGFPRGKEGIEDPFAHGRRSVLRSAFASPKSVSRRSLSGLFCLPELGADCLLQSGGLGCEVVWAAASDQAHPSAEWQGGRPNGHPKSLHQAGPRLGSQGLSRSGGFWPEPSLCAKPEVYAPTSRETGRGSGLRFATGSCVGKSCSSWVGTLLGMGA